MITHPSSPEQLSLVSASIVPARVASDAGTAWEVSGDQIARARAFMAASDEAFQHANDGPMEAPC